MSLSIGEVIRELRQKQNITQEKLASYLGISFQAISKWENGTALPDITLIPPIANFFNVSIDKLFNIEQHETSEKIIKYKEEYQRLCNSGDVKGRIGLLEKALLDYPRCYQFLLWLGESYYDYSYNGQEQHKGKELGYPNKIIDISTRILDDCQNDTIRQSTIALLCKTYSKLGFLEEALELMQYVPKLGQSKEIVMEEILQGEERQIQIQTNILLVLEHLTNSFVQLTFSKDLGKNKTNEQKIQYFETLNQIYELILYDHNYGYFHRLLAWNYRRLAELYCSIGDDNKAIEELQKAEIHATKYDQLPQVSQYTSIFIDKCNFDKDKFTKNWQGSEVEQLYYRTKEMFENLKQYSEFVDLQERLKKQIRVQK